MKSSTDEMSDKSEKSIAAPERPTIFVGMMSSHEMPHVIVQMVMALRAPSDMAVSVLTNSRNDFQGFDHLMTTSCEAKSAYTVICRDRAVWEAKVMMEFIKTSPTDVYVDRCRALIIIPKAVLLGLAEKVGTYRTPEHSKGLLKFGYPIEDPFDGMLVKTKIGSFLTLLKIHKIPVKELEFESYVVRTVNDLWLPKETAKTVVTKAVAKASNPKGKGEEAEPTKTEPVPTPTPKDKEEPEPAPASKGKKEEPEVSAEAKSAQTVSIDRTKFKEALKKVGASDEEIEKQLALLPSESIDSTD